MTFDEEQWQQDCREALERAVGPYRMPTTDEAWDVAYPNASILHMAEEDAATALGELARTARELADQVTNPLEPQDERVPFRYTSLSYDYEAATIAMAALAALRNRVRPER